MRDNEQINHNLTVYICVDKVDRKTPYLVGETSILHTHPYSVHSLYNKNKNKFPVVSSDIVNSTHYCHSIQQ